MDWTMLQPICVVLVASLLSRIRINEKIHPLNLLGSSFFAIANKVNKAHRSNKQQSIAGALALIIMLIMIASGFAVLQFVIIEPFIFELFTLTLLLQWHQISLPKVALGTLEKDTLIAQLKPNTLRDVDTLSLLGLHKAAIESLCLKNAYQWFAVLFWYMTIGIWAAIVYRLIQLMAHHWNCKLAEFSAFGRASSILLIALSTPSHFILSITLSLFNKPATTLTKAKQQASAWHSAATGYLIASFANSLSIQLGGPRKYQGRVTRYNQLGTTTPPERKDITIAQQRLTIAAVLWLALFIILSVLAYHYGH